MCENAEAKKFLVWRSNNLTIVNQEKETRYLVRIDLMLVRNWLYFMVLSKGRGQTNRCQLDLDLSYGGDKDKDKDKETVERIGLSEN